jgi:hypothetical protein
MKTSLKESLQFFGYAHHADYSTDKYEVINIFDYSDDTAFSVESNFQDSNQEMLDWVTNEKEQVA